MSLELTFIAFLFISKGKFSISMNPPNTPSQLLFKSVISFYFSFLYEARNSESKLGLILLLFNESLSNHCLQIVEPFFYMFPINLKASITFGSLLCLSDEIARYWVAALLRKKKSKQNFMRKREIMGILGKLRSVKITLQIILLKSLVRIILKF